VCVCGATAQLGPTPPRGFWYTNNQTYTWRDSSERMVSSLQRLLPIHHTMHERWTSMPLARFKPAIPAVKWLQTYALDCTATGIYHTINYVVRITCFLWKEKGSKYCSVVLMLIVHEIVYVLVIQFWFRFLHPCSLNQYVFVCYVVLKCVSDPVDEHNTIQKQC